MHGGTFCSQPPPSSLLFLRLFFFFPTSCDRPKRRNQKETKRTISPTNSSISTQPYTSLSSYPWRSGEDFKLFLLKYPRLASFISLVRDRDTGSVFRDNNTGNPRIKYSISDFDREHGLEGTIGLCKICYATGAAEIQPYFPGLEPWVASPGGPPTSVADGEDPEFVDPRFAAWLARVRAVGNKPPIGIWASAHQMGTCRMAASPEKGVVDAAGKVWGREGLYVADASVFPSASGVNPMVTVMAISDWISRRVADDLASAEAQS